MPRSTIPTAHSDLRRVGGAGGSVLAGLLLACITLAPMQARAADVTPTARLDLDYAAPNADTQPMSDEFLVRRAQLGLTGNFNHDWSFTAVYDFAIDGEFKDVDVQYGGWSAGQITVGQFRVPFGMDVVTSSKTIMMIERALPLNAFDIPRRLGVGFSRDGERQTISVMGFGRSIDNDAGNGVAARYTIAPIDADGTVLHLGAAVAIEDPLDGEVKFSSRPESRPTDDSFVNTGTLDGVSRVVRTGLELAWQTGPFTAQSEWMQAHADRQFDPDARFDGWYVSGSWMFNGGHRRYADGIFNGPSLGKPWGTWELTARYSHVNLNDGAVQGGRETNVSLGVNWYIRDHGRVMLNYIKVRSDSQGVSDNPDILLLQTQFYF